jgi:hypothetical protein
MKAKIVLATFIVFVGNWLGGCAASVPMASAEADTKAKTFVAPTDGNGGLYVYRDESFGGAVKLPLLLDNVSIGDTGPQTYAFREVTPGKHTVLSKAEKDESLEIEVQAGKDYYVWQEVKMGVWSARSALHLVDNKIGEDAVKKCKLIQ